MDKIWANRLIAGTKTWDQVPLSRKISVAEELKRRVISGEITKEQYTEITGYVYI